MDINKEEISPSLEIEELQTEDMETDTESTQESAEGSTSADKAKMDEMTSFESGYVSQNLTMNNKFIIEARKPLLGLALEYAFRFNTPLNMSSADEAKYFIDNQLLRKMPGVTNFELYKPNEQSEDSSTDQSISQLSSTWSQEQEDFVKFISNEVLAMSAQSEPKTKCILLTGYAGTGKTNTLERLRVITNASILCVANTNSLCASIAAKFKLPIMNFYMFLRESLPLNLMLQEKDVVRIIFLDEFSMFSPFQLLNFIEIIEKASIAFNEKFIIIMCGDFMHIPPLFPESLNYEPIIEKCDTCFNFKEQLRTKDLKYLNMLIKLTEGCPEEPQEYLQELRTIIPLDSHKTLIEYIYPTEYIEPVYQKFRESSSNLYSWLNELEPDFFNKVLTLKAYAYENKEVNYMNHGLAWSIIHQLLEQGKNDAFITSYVSFVNFSKAEDMNATIDNLPLIRYFPYRVLVNAQNISKGAIVYLIDWNLEAGCILVCQPITKQISIVSCESFFMNLYPQQLCYGIPMEMAFASTFHKIQGETVIEDIAVSLSNIDHRELFAILSRVDSAERIKYLA